MLDRKYIVEHAEEVQQNCRRRGVEVDVARLVELEQQRRAKLQEVQELNRRANEVSKSIGKAKDPDEREARKAEGRRLREAKEAAQAEH
ncbi:MAG TPA: serine--tRNA ligase, partial [Planctomycetaceae bacterium]|nr:serine--tRNA ligase [Planctomycetaceae bacterium]